MTSRHLPGGVISAAQSNQRFDDLEQVGNVNTGNPNFHQLPLGLLL
jgi:hypothetical protein